jgi:gamma-glutamyl-gamma-aminobutyrate hydrolase PuuD
LKIDLKKGYHEIKFNDESHLHMVNVKRNIQGKKNVIRYSIFQQAVDQILQRLEIVAVFADDIIITGVKDKDHTLEIWRKFYINFWKLG